MRKILGRMCGEVASMMLDTNLERENCVIELKDVRKSYNGKVIFEDVNLKIEDGTVTAFVGHNGGVENETA